VKTVPRLQRVVVTSLLNQRRIDLFLYCIISVPTMFSCLAGAVDNRGLGACRWGWSGPFGRRWWWRWQRQSRYKNIPNNKKPKIILLKGIIFQFFHRYDNVYFCFIGRKKVIERKTSGYTRSNPDCAKCYWLHSLTRRTNKKVRFFSINFL